MRRAPQTGPNSFVLSERGSELWRWAALRGAGFPARDVLGLASPLLGAASDRVLAAREACRLAFERLAAALRAEGGDEAIVARARRARKRADREKLPNADDVAGLAEVEWTAARAALLDVEEADRTFEDAWRGELARIAEVVRDHARSPRFREAVAWQNRLVLSTGFDPLLRGSGSPSQTRQHEDLVVSYLHRYCVKNDTIGFFGPVGWARIGDGVDFVSRPGASLLAHRSVKFEHWGIAALAAAFARQPEVAPWLRPRVHAFVIVEEASAWSMLCGRVELTTAELALVRACDGRRTSRELCDELVARGVFADAQAFDLALASLRERKLVSEGFDLPVRWDAEELLAERVAAIGEPSLRADLEDRLSRLTARRDEVAAAAGEPEELVRALDALDAAFVAATDEAPSRAPGAMYAARTLVYEDTRRDHQVVIGSKFLEEIGPALELVLASARWASHEVGHRYETSFRKTWDELARAGGAGSVRFIDLWSRIQRFVRGKKFDQFAPVSAELLARWKRLLAPQADARRWNYAASDLAPMGTTLFHSEHAGYLPVRYHSPDLMVAAKDAAAIARGDYLAVLGELHICWNTIDNAFFVSQHPAPEELFALADASVPGPLATVESSVEPVRIKQRFFGRSGLQIEMGVEPAGAVPPARRVPASDLVVELVDERLVVRSKTRPLELPLENALAYGLASAVVTRFALVDGGEHMPRITVDKLVYARESWRFRASAMAFAYVTGEAAAFREARAFARTHGLPRFVFAKVPVERKPVFVDFDSPIALRILARIVRRAKDHPAGEQTLTLTEMLPSLDECWLADAAGASYTSEFRLVAVERS